MAQEGFHLAELVTGITLLMLVAAVTTMLSKRLSRLPLTIALVFVGALAAAASERIPGLGSLAISFNSKICILKLPYVALH